MKQLLLSLIAATVLAAPVLAQQAADDHSAHHPPGAAQASAEMADGEVRRVDKSTGKITLRHGPIKSLDMPPMTMVFQAGDPAMLDRIKQGDKVRFAAEEKSGAYVVTRIEPAR
jgi:Cu(I)/Ag(I) efflux system protein CusF